jgi:hypothetical protein
MSQTGQLPPIVLFPRIRIIGHGIVGPNYHFHVYWGLELGPITEVLVHQPFCYSMN